METPYGRLFSFISRILSSSSSKKRLKGISKNNKTKKEQRTEHTMDSIWRKKIQRKTHENSTSKL